MPKGHSYRREWACVGHNPTTWILGVRNGDRVGKVIASVNREPSGAWYWVWWNMDLGRPPMFGIEPSRVHAMRTAIRHNETEVSHVEPN